MFSKKIWALFILFFCFVVSVQFSPLFAQESGLLTGETGSTNPKDRPVNMSLTVEDTAGPTTPTLVSPSNSSITTDNTPSFVWEESTAVAGMNHYTLTLDGSTLYSNIPLTATSNVDYTLTKSGTQYTLVPSASIADGLHTWKITAVDNNSKSADSSTWTFTIDTTSPTLVITQIDGTTTSISSQDLSTRPDPYLTIYTNQPTIKGNSEAGATIVLTVSLPSEPSQVYIITVDSSGNWSQTLPLLTRDVKITMNFTVTDLAGHITTLDNVYFLIATSFLLSTPVPTPQPGATAIVPTPGPGIPTTPITETVQNILSNFVPSQIPQVVKDFSNATAPIATALLSVAIPIAATTLVATQFGWSLSVQIFFRILQALGILPPPSPQGLVFDSETEKPVAFAILNISRVDTQGTSETVVTNTEGVYGGVQLPPGKYQIEVRHQDFVFPTVKTRPTYLTLFEFYKGEVFQVSNEKTRQLFLIPVDHINQAQGSERKISWSLIKERLLRLSQYLFLPLFFISILITLYSPTMINMGVCVIYIAMLVLKVVRWTKRPLIVGKVVDSSGAPLANVFVRIFLQESNQLMSVLVTDKKGSFKAFLPPNEYQVSLSKQKYVWVEDGKVQNFYLADARNGKVLVLAVMEDAQQLYKDLFA
ncbi:MAG: carboxypeptidase regulatory-like domain-containing protein [Patescibacteria group bacterium]